MTEPRRIRVAVESQWDERRQTLVLSATRLDVSGSEPWTTKVTARTQERADDLLAQFRQTYLDAGAEV